MHFWTHVPLLKKGDYIVLDPDGLVKNVVPGYEKL